MASVGIDIGGHAHVAARCRIGEPRADRTILRIAQSRAGFDAVDAWLNALGHCMRKALGIVWGVWRNGVDFDPNWGTRA